MAKSPKPSGAYDSRKKRGRIPVLVTLSPKAKEALRDLAELDGSTLSAVVERLIEEETERRHSSS